MSVLNFKYSSVSTGDQSCEHDEVTENRNIQGQGLEITPQKSLRTMTRINITDGYVL